MLFNDGVESNMTCVLRVRNTEDSGWFKILNKILRKIEGVSYEYTNEGVIYISGRVKPRKIFSLVAKHGHKVELCGMETGHKYVGGAGAAMVPNPMPPNYPPTRHQYVGGAGAPMPMPMPMPYPPFHQYPY